MDHILSRICDCFHVLDVLSCRFDCIGEDFCESFVVRELQRRLPGEDLIYYGDSANYPYADKTAEQLFQLSSRMLRFLSKRQVKCTAVACNTISSMLDRLRPCFDHDIIGVIDGTANYVIREKLQRVGLELYELNKLAVLQF